MGSLESKQDIRDFVRGAALMGAGGGGNPEDAIEWLDSAFEDGKELKWTDPDAIEKGSWSACPFLMGSLAPTTEEQKKKMEDLCLTDIKFESIQARSVQLLEEHMDVKIKSLVAGETGAASCGGTLAAASRLGIDAVDGDYCGRAVPEAIQTTPYLDDLPLWPMSCVDKYGNLSIIEECTSYGMAERLGKFIASASFGLAGETGFLFEADKMTEVVVKGTFSKSLEVGKAIRVANENGENPVNKIIDKIGGWRLFEGVIAEVETEDRDGYYWGETTLEGEGDFTGSTFKIWFQNENHISWIDDELFVTSPDIMSLVYVDTGEPVMNNDLRVGSKGAVLGFKSPTPFRTEKGLDILGPKHFGYEHEYVPIEELMKEREGR